MKIFVIGIEVKMREFWKKPIRRTQQFSAAEKTRARK